LYEKVLKRNHLGVIAKSTDSTFSKSLKLKKNLTGNVFRYTSAIVLCNVEISLFIIAIPFIIAKFKNTWHGTNMSNEATTPSQFKL
jgi:hypothetical protein